MINGKKDLQNELLSYRFEFDLLQKIPCSKEDNKKYQKAFKESRVLPEGVYAYEDFDGGRSETEFYTVYKPHLSESEITEYLTYKKLHLIKTIKNCVVFFTALTAAAIIAALIIFIISIS